MTASTSPRAPRPRSLRTVTAPPEVALALLLGALAPAPAEAQYFGRNQVMWEEFDFQRADSEHFALYYYPPDNPLAPDLVRMSERWYGRLGTAFDHRPEDRTLVIFYTDQPDFRQTTLSHGLIGEGVGGFTEPYRRRVVLPIAGTYAETDHVLGHELVHAFQFDIASALAEGRAGGGGAGLGQVPLWMVEGLAEYFSVGSESTLTAMWLRDAMGREALPDFRRLNRGGEYNPYRFGHAFYAWVGGRWNDRTVSRLFATAIAADPQLAIEEVLGMSPEEAFEAWHEDIRESYQPVVEGRSVPGQHTKPLLTRETTGGDLNIAPSLSPDGTRIAFLSTRDLFTIVLYLADARTGEVQRKLASAAGNPHFDALRFLDSSGAWSPDGTRFAFPVFAEGDQALVVVDVASGEVIERYQPPVDALSNPAWSPDGRTIAFTGTTAGLHDLYLLEVESGEVRRLTDDPHAELEPAFSPDGRTIALVTDRGPGTDLGTLSYGPPGLALYDLATGSLERLEVFPGARHISPHFSPDGAWLYFVADPDGVSDLYRVRIAGGTPGTTERLTRLTTGVSGFTELSPALSVAARTGEVAFSVFRDFRYEIHTLGEGAGELPVPPAVPARRAALLPPRPEEPGVVETVVDAYLTRPRAGLPPEEARFEAEPYDADIGLTYIGPPTVAVGTDRYGVGVAGSFSAIFSDPLDRHQIGVVFQGGTATDDDFGTLFGGQIGYLNRAHRLGWGGEVAHLPYVSARTFVSSTVVEIDGQPVPANIVSQIREEVTIDEVTGILEYPLSIRHRFEAGVGYSHFGFDREIEEVLVVGNTVIDRQESGLPSLGSIGLYRGSLAFVGDSSFFGLASPARGARYRFEVTANGGDLSYQSALADYRRYVFRRPVTLAFRGVHFGRYGDDAEDERLNDLYVGRATLVRGYEIGDFDLSECTAVPGSDACPEFDRLIGSRMAVANLELRVPLAGVEGYGLVQAPWLPTELVLFADAGTAWTEDETPELRFDEDTAERVPVASAGVALRMVLGGLVPIELYYAHPFQRPDEDWQFGFVIAPGW